MATARMPQLGFKGHGFAKRVVAAFGVERVSADGGALLLKTLDARVAVTATVARC